jgi:hypothetical protein
VTCSKRWKTKQVARPKYFVARRMKILGFWNVAPCRLVNRHGATNPVFCVTLHTLKIKIWMQWRHHNKIQWRHHHSEHTDRRTTRQTTGMILTVYESYRVSIIVCELEISKMRRPRSDWGCCVTQQKRLILGAQRSWKNDPEQWADGNLEEDGYFSASTSEYLKHAEQNHENFGHYRRYNIQ